MQIARALLWLPSVLALACSHGAATEDDSADGTPADASVRGPVSFEEQLLSCEESGPTRCPGNNDDGLSRHGGLVEGAICQFALVDQNMWTAKGALIDTLSEDLPLVSTRGLLDDLDRGGLAVEASHPELVRLEALTAAFTWDADDQTDRAWVPQGISGSADATADEQIDGRSVVAVSWYNKPERNPDPTINMGSRVTFVDTTDLGAGSVAYAHVLLVDPYDSDGAADFRAVRIHVGGIAWVGDYLYAVDTNRGLRVFDTTRMLAIDSLDDGIGRDPQMGGYRAYGHRYALPQVGAYYLSGDSCVHRFSYVSLDKTSEVPSLVTGEFHKPDIAGKLMRWPLDGERLALSDPIAGVSQPHEVFFSQENKLQGVASIDGRWYVSSSSQDGDWGRLYRTAPGEPSDRFGWVTGPEDLMVADGGATLWSLSEFSGRRYVFGVDVSSYE